MTSPRDLPEVRIQCPRCHRKNLIVARHMCSRFVCSGPDCPAWDARRCLTPKCEYPSPQGAAAYDRKYGRTETLDGQTITSAPIWERGRWANRDAERIFTQKREPLPPPYNARIAPGQQGNY